MSDPALNHPTLTRIVTAHHEAAHAVVQYRVGGSADDVVTILPTTIRHRGEAIASLGHAAGACGSDSFCPADEEARILSCYAGGHAQRRCDPQTADDGCDVDDAIADEILRFWGWEQREHEFRDRSRELVEQHWPENVAVATELLNVSRLDSEEVELIADAAVGTAEFLHGDLASDLAMYRALRPSPAVDSSDE